MLSFQKRALIVNLANMWFFIKILISQNSLYNGFRKIVINAIDLNNILFGLENRIQILYKFLSINAIV